MRFEIGVEFVLGVVPLVKPFILEQGNEEFLFEEFVVEVAQHLTVDHDAVSVPALEEVVCGAEDHLEL